MNTLRVLTEKDADAIERALETIRSRLSEKMAYGYSIVFDVTQISRGVTAIGLDMHDPDGNGVKVIASDDYYHTWIATAIAMTHEHATQTTKKK